MKRTPLKRRTPLARGPGPKRTPMKRYRKPSAVAKADALAAAIVHARGKCAVREALRSIGGDVECCAGPLEQHHARGRGKGFRWRTESHLLLCAAHHRTRCMAPHVRPALWRQWMEQFWPEILAMPDVPETAEQAVERMNDRLDRPDVAKETT